MKKYFTKTISPVFILLLLLLALLAGVYLVKTQQQDIRKRAAPLTSIPTPTPTINCRFGATLSIKDPRGNLITNISGFSHLWQIFNYGKLVGSGSDSIPPDKGFIKTDTPSLNPKYRNGSSDVTISLPANFEISGRWCTSVSGNCPDTSGTGNTLSGFSLDCGAAYDYGWFIRVPPQFVSILAPEIRSTVKGDKAVFQATTPINPAIKRVWLKHVSDPFLQTDDPPSGWIARANGAPEVVGDKYLWTGDCDQPTASCTSPNGHAWDTTGYPDGLHTLQAVALTNELGTIVESGKIPIAVQNIPPTPTPTSMPTPTPLFVIKNGDFENGFTDWSHGGDLPQSVIDRLSNGEAPYQGNYSALLGDPETQCIPQTRIHANMFQDFPVPNISEPVSLSFAYRIFTHDVINLSYLIVYLHDVTIDKSWVIVQDGLPGSVFGGWCSNDLGWRTFRYDLSPFKGHSVRLSFYNHNFWPGSEWYNSHGIWTYIDDVKLEIGQPITSPTQVPSLTQTPPTQAPEPTREP